MKKKKEEAERDQKRIIISWQVINHIVALAHAAHTSDKFVQKTISNAIYSGVRKKGAGTPASYNTRAPAQ